MYTISLVPIQDQETHNSANGNEHCGCGGNLVSKIDLYSKCLALNSTLSQSNYCYTTQVQSCNWWLPVNNNTQTATICLL